MSAGNESLTAETSDAYTAGVVWSSEVNASWIEGFTVSLDYYNLEVKDAIASRIASDVLTACVNTLDPLFCDLTPRTAVGSLGVLDNQLQNIGGIEAAGYDLMASYSSPDWSFGQIVATLNATFLDKYSETTANVDNSTTVTDRKGTHTNETFQRAFPELRTVTTIDWLKDRWNGTMAFRWTDSMTDAAGGNLDSAMFTDLRLSYTPPIANDGIVIAIGFNNVFDEDPPILFTSTISMSNVVT